MKKCLYCAQDLEDSVTECPFCHKPQDSRKSDKWYFRTYIFVIAFMCVGLFAMPLLWFNPRYKLKTKIIWSIILIGASAFILYWFGYSWASINRYYSLLSEVNP